METSDLDGKIGVLATLFPLGGPPTRSATHRIPNIMTHPTAEWAGQQIIEFLALDAAKYAVAGLLYGTKFGFDLHAPHEYRCRNQNETEMKHGYTIPRLN